MLVGGERAGGATPKRWRRWPRGSASATACAWSATPTTCRRRCARRRGGHRLDRAGGVRPRGDRGAGDGAAGDRHRPWRRRRRRWRTARPAGWCRRAMPRRWPARSMRRSTCRRTSARRSASARAARPCSAHYTVAAMQRRRRWRSIADVIGRGTGRVSRILVIRLGALGDFVLSFGAVRGHPRAPCGATEITLLTGAAVRRAGAAGAVVRPGGGGCAAGGVEPGLGCCGCAGSWPGSISSTTCRPPIVRLVFPAGRAAAVGRASRAAARIRTPTRGATRMHTLERQARAAADGRGDRHFRAPDLGWLARPSALRGAGAPYAVLVPGAAARRPRKRWPAARYGALAALLAGRGITPVVVGGAGGGAAGRGHPRRLPRGGRPDRAHRHCRPCGAGARRRAGGRQRYRADASRVPRWGAGRWCCFLPPAIRP